MLPFRFRAAARPWEYRWRALILFGSQPVLVTAHWWANGFQGEWGAIHVPPATGLCALALASAGVLLRIWATGSMSAAVMASSTPNTDRLVDQGSYGLSRNTLYIGSMLIFGAYGLFFGWMWSVVYFLFHWFRYVRIVAYEENLLRSRWGEKFDRYCQQVPRWIPRMRHLRNASFHSASWVDGCLGNSVFVGIVLGYAAAAWFGALEVLIPFEAAGFAVAGLYLWYTNRRSELSTAGRTEISAAAHTVPIRTVTRKAS